MLGLGDGTVAVTTTPPVNALDVNLRTMLDRLTRVDEALVAQQNAPLTFKSAFETALPYVLSAILTAIVLGKKSV